MPYVPAQGALRYVTIAMLCGVPLLFGVLAALMGQDANWDLRNYHWYNAYAALNARAAVDMGAAQISAFYNPTLDLPFYYLANVLPARIVALLLGAIQGCNFVLLYMLAVRALSISEERRRVAVAGAIAFVGMIGGGNLGLLGTTFYDNVVSLFVFGAIAVILHSAALIKTGSMRAALPRVAVAGIMLGFAVGLKLPTQIFAVGVCFGLLFIPGPFFRRFMLSFVCGLGIIAGFLVFGGWWLWEMWSLYGNPLFPYFNHLIQSPWALPESYRDDRFTPKTLAAALLFPFRFALDAKTGGEIVFRDLRLAVAYIILLATPLALWLSRARGSAVEPFAARYLMAMAALSYGIWLALFGIYRYLIPLEMLAPLLIATGVALWPLGRWKFAAAAVLLALVTVTARPGTWGRIPWTGGSFVDVTAPEVRDPANTIVLMTGFAPTSFVIPAFPPETAFLRPHSYLVEPSHRTKFNEVMHDRIAAHSGDFLLLQASWERWAASEVLPALGLEPDFTQCQPLTTNLDKQLELCVVTRVSESPPS